MQEQILQLLERVTALEDKLKQRELSQLQLPLDENSTNILKQFGFLKGTPLAGVHTYYVAVSSGGAVTTPITITNGIQTA